MRRLMMTALLGLIAPTAVQAVIRYVPQEYPNIQAAISACSNGDEVVVANQTWSGAGNWDITFPTDPFGNPKNIVVRSANLNPSLCIIDCSDNGTPHRAFSIQNGGGSGTRIEGFTIQNGVGWGGS